MYDNDKVPHPVFVGIGLAGIIATLLLLVAGAGKIMGGQ